MSFRRLAVTLALAWLWLAIVVWRMTGQAHAQRYTGTVTPVQDTPYMRQEAAQREQRQDDLIEENTRAIKEAVKETKDAVVELHSDIVSNRTATYQAIDEIGTMRGVVIGATSAIALLQTLGLIAQLRKAKP